MVDATGASKYTSIQKATFYSITDFGLFPNPTSGDTYLNLAEHVGKAIDIKIYSSLGHLLYEQQLPAVQEKHIQLNTSEFKNGLYLVTVREAGHAPVSGKLVVRRMY